MKITLNEEQETALDIIKDKRHYGVFFDMGVGKTALMLALIEYLAFDKLEVNNVLIIAPASVANRLNVWQDEIKKWENFSYFDFHDLSGTAKERVEKINTKKSSITIMSDSLVDWWFETYGNLYMFDMIIVDESSRFKSSKSIRFKRLAKMIDLNRHRVYLLSGTPVPNGLEDVWSQIFLLDKGERLGTSFWKFIDTYFFVINYNRILYKNNRDIIMDKIKDICVFASSDKIALTKKVEEKIYFEFTPEKQKMFKDFKDDYILQLDQKEITVLSKQILINKCLQLSNGCIYHDAEGNYTTFDDSKLKFVEEYSEKHPEENILVFYSFKFDKIRLLKLKGARAIETTQDKDDWNSGKIKLGIISPYSFQYGGNLQYGGYTIIWFGLMWGLENYLQSNKRIWRQGQKHDVKIMYLMMKNTWDDHVYKAVVTKEIDQKDFLNKIDMRKEDFDGQMGYRVQGQ
jgi:SNF2 family DNA or RNA helicase